LDIIGRDETFSEHGFQVSAPPPAKKTAGLIEKETLKNRMTIDD
jgi:hypothetical protein